MNSTTNTARQAAYRDRKRAEHQDMRRACQALVNALWDSRGSNPAAIGARIQAIVPGLYSDVHIIQLVAAAITGPGDLKGA